MDRIVDERPAFTIEGNAKDQPVELTPQQIERTLPWPLGKPDRVDQLSQHPFVVACEGKAPRNRWAGDIDLRRRPASQSQRSEAIVFARRAYFEYWGKGLEQPLVIFGAELRNA